MGNERLSEEKINELIEFHKTIKDKKDADKIKCVIYWGKNWTWKQIEEALFISNPTISRIVNEYKNLGMKGLIGTKYTGHNYKLTSEQEKILCKYLSSHFIYNSKQVCAYVKRKFNLHYTDQGMVQTLHRLGYVYKKPKIIPGYKPSEQDQIKAANEINDKIDNLEENEALFYVDGAGFVHNLKINYGWIKKGSEKILKSNTGRKKINVNGAYNPLTQDVICIEKEGTMSQDDNILLLDKILLHFPRLTKIILVLDNARTNRGKIFTEYTKNIENVDVELYYIPAYCPNLNLIERLWKYSKKLLLSKYYRKFGRFKEGIMNFFEKDVKQTKNKKKLKTFIGRKFQIISI